MATLNQDFTKFDYDKFLIIFTITDLDSSMDSNYAAWWGTSIPAPNGSETAYVQKSSGAEVAGGANTNFYWQFDTSVPTGFPTSNEITIGASTVTVPILQSDFGASPLWVEGNDYYHELVLTNNKTEDNSVVVATGTFTLNYSLFTQEGYRPI